MFDPAIASLFLANNSLHLTYLSLLLPPSLQPVTNLCLSDGADSQPQTCSSLSFWKCPLRNHRPVNCPLISTPTIRIKYLDNPGPTRYAHPPFQLPSGAPPASPIARPSADAVVLDQNGALRPHQPRNLQPQHSGRFSEDGGSSAEATTARGKHAAVAPPAAPLQRASSARLEAPHTALARSESADRIQLRPPSAGEALWFHSSCLEWVLQCPGKGMVLQICNGLIAVL